MKEIVFSIFKPGEEPLTNLETLLEKFEQEHKIHVRLEAIEWSVGWNRQVEMALYQHGPDLSHTGSTWVMDLARMNALRPFSASEVKNIVAGKDYFQYSTSDGMGIESDGSHVTWAVPFSGDVRVVSYRRDLLEQAGVDEGIAFRNSANFENTLAKLKANGVETALALPTDRSNIGLHNLASWIWSFGGDFCNADGTEIEFDTPKAMDGIKAYFRLGRYTGNRRLDESDSSLAFFTGKAAVLLSGSVNPDYILNPEVRENLGIASALDAPFVGPDVLVVWKHSRYPDEALALIQFLSQPESGKFLFPTFGFPPYREGWQYPPFDKPQYKVMMHALQTGRSFPISQLWALIEKRFIDVIPEIWDEVFANHQNSDTIVEQKINAMASRLRRTLES